MDNEEQTTVENNTIVSTETDAVTSAENKNDDSDTTKKTTENSLLLTMETGYDEQLKHEEYWKTIKSESENEIMKLFGNDGSISIKEIVEHDYTSIDNEGDANKILSYIFDHSVNSSEKTSGIISICKWIISNLHIRKTIENLNNK